MNDTPVFPTAERISPLLKNVHSAVKTAYNRHSPNSRAGPAHESVSTTVGGRSDEIWIVVNLPNGGRMAAVVNTIKIGGPAEAVFDLVTTARFWPEWHPATRAVGGG